MGKCYCDYCDVFLTHDSVAVRKQHNDGNRHKQNVCDYYRQFIGQKTQRAIDAVVAAFERKVRRGEVHPTYGLPSLNPAAPVRNDALPPVPAAPQPGATALPPTAQAPPAATPIIGAAAPAQGDLAIAAAAAAAGGPPPPPQAQYAGMASPLNGNYAPQVAQTASVSPSIPAPP